MVMLGVTNQEVLQHNANRSYPLSEQATKRPIQGAADFSIPDNFLVAAKLVINATPETVNIANFYIGRLIVYNKGVNIEFHYDGVKIGVATAYDRGRFNTTFPITGLHNSEFNYGLSGHVTIGSFEQIKCALGDYAFDLEGTRLDADVVQYSTAAVTSITVISNGTEYAPIRGDIKIVAGQNINIQEEHHEDGHTILHIHRRVNPEVDIPQYIKTINAVRPDIGGNIAIVSSSDCLEVAEANAQITLSETCCTPCCGCEELSSIEQSIQLFQD